MPGKDKTSKAGKGKKALEKEWEAAVSAADSGSRLAAATTNKDEHKQNKKASGGRK
jgi:hypothetical protein